MCHLIKCLNFQVASLKATDVEPIAIYFTIEMLKIAQILQKASIIHADIKPENFLVQRMYVLYLFLLLFNPCDQLDKQALLILLKAVSKVFVNWSRRHLFMVPSIVFS